MIDKAVALLESQPAGAELVAAYALLAGRRTFAGDRTGSVAAAEQALALAAKLGLPEPAFALHWRGIGRCGLGDVGGVEDTRRALQLALEQGQGRETAVIHGNLAWVVWFCQGSQPALDINEEGIAFCERRGITEVALHMHDSRLSLLAQLGRTEEALAEVGPLADRLDAVGDIDHVVMRALQLLLLAERGTPEQAPAPETLVGAARDIGLPSFIAHGFAASAQLLLAQGRPEQARALLHELDELDELRADVDYAWLLPSLLRVALALGDPALAQRLTTGTEPLTPIHENALASAQAQLAEAVGEHADAARLYADASRRWHEFGSVPEHAYALLGEGRCLATLNQRDAEGPLHGAKDLFASMGYKPALAETQALLDRHRVAAS
jgi:tetratricopeptide (TPR) repeat protein